MRDRVAHVDKVWRRMKLFFFVWPFWCALIIGLNIWHDVSEGWPLDWRNFLGGVGVLAGGGVVFVWSWLILKFVRSVSAKLDHRR